MSQDVNEVQGKEAMILAEAWPILANKRQRERKKQACAHVLLSISPAFLSGVFSHLSNARMGRSWQTRLNRSEEREREFTPFQPHRADPGAARTVPWQIP